MPDDLSYFIWSVPESGYQWLRTQAGGQERPGNELFLVDAKPSTLRRYYPLEQENGLFRTFAGTEPTEAGILKFANRYGSLGAGLMIRVAPGKEPGSHRLGHGEPMRAWYSELSDMRELIALWDAARTANHGPLAEVIKWHGSRGVSYESGREVFDWIATDREPELLSQFRQGDLVMPALHYLQRHVNKKLADCGVTSRLLWDRKYTRLSLYIVPNNLIGCLWLQFARAIDGDRQYRRCPDCRKWFETTPHVTRADRVFCSPTCKASAHRKKIAEARKLRAQGLPIREIAKRLETDVKTAKGWTK
jgi:hypothetical protein